MALSKKGQAIAITLTIIIYAACLGLNALSGGRINSKLFPQSIGNVSRIFHLDATPSGATFSIWGFIFTYQLIWMIYMAVAACRSGDATSLLPGSYYITFNLNIILTIVWLFVWTRMKIVMAFAALTLGSLLLDTSIIIASKSIHDYVTTNKITSTNKADIWCHRILLQNGLLFYATWTTVASLLSTGIVLVYHCGMENKTASLMVLALLGVLVILYFICENFLFRSYLEHVISPYATLTWALGGVLKKSYGRYEDISYLAMGLLAMTLIFFVSRVIVIMASCVRKKQQSTCKILLINCEKK